MTSTPAPPRRPEPLALNHVGLRVPDILSAVEWYTSMLGFVLLDGPHRFERSTAPSLMRTDYGEQWSALLQAHLASATGMGVELFEFEGVPTPPAAPCVADVPHASWRPGSVPDLGLYHLCLTSHQIDQLAEELDRHGGHQRTPVDEPAANTYRIAYCEDPFGNALEINDRSYEQAHANRGGART